MATKTAKKIATPKLNVQHSYITLKLPTGNFTTSFGGAKVSGQLVKMKGAFEALDSYVRNASKTKSFGEAMNDLLDTRQAYFFDSLKYLVKSRIINRK